MTLPTAVFGEEKGAALILVLGWSSLLLPLVGWLYLQAHTDQILAQNLRKELDAFYTAEAGLNFALAATSACDSPACALRGPDGVLGTADDGLVLPGPSDWAPFGDQGRGFRVRVTEADSATVRIRSSGTGWGGGTSEVEALVRWQPDGTKQVFWNQLLEP